MKMNTWTIPQEKCLGAFASGEDTDQSVQFLFFFSRPPVACLRIEIHEMVQNRLVNS